jgi:putative transposase
MVILRAYKTELDPTRKQVELLLQHAGCARWAYNWGLRRKIEAYEATGESPSAIELHRELNTLKTKSVEEGGVPWMYESSKCAPQEALRNLDLAYKNFFRRCKEGVRHKGAPRFKSRKNGVGSFRLTGVIRASQTRVQLPVLGKLRLKEHGYLPTEGVKVLSATVTESAGRWFVSLQVEREMPELAPRPAHVVGVDVGIKNLAVTSDGQVFVNPRALIGAQKTLRNRHKAVSRKVKGSANRKKAAARMAKTHRRVANIRRDAIHKMTTAITKSASNIVVEDLNVSGMMKNHHLARALSDASLAEIRRQLAYKAKWNGVGFIEAGRFYPSSKRCSDCGAVKDNLDLGERTYLCTNASCGLIIDRDLNAAINLKMWPQVSAVSACRPGGAGRARKSPTKLLVGQEPNEQSENGRECGGHPLAHSETIDTPSIGR